jgi:hypothetical protein
MIISVYELLISCPDIGAKLILFNRSSIKANMAAEDEVEQTLLILRECFVYKIPPRTTAAGYK